MLVCFFKQGYGLDTSFTYRGVLQSIPLPQKTILTLLYLEALQIRVMMLEDPETRTKTKTKSCEHSQYFNLVLKASETFGLQVSNLGRTAKISYNYLTVSEGSFDKIPCPADNCNRFYAHPPRLHDHIRTSTGNGHKALVSLIDQICCIQCKKHFRQSKALFHHEISCHKE